MIRPVPVQEFLSEAFANRWKALLQKCPPYDLGQTHAWNQCWWRHFERTGSSEKQLFILADEKGDELEALWPLFLRQRRGVRVLHWIGQAEGMITDYMMPLLPTGTADKAAQALIEYLAENAALWDVLDLNLPQFTGLFPVLTKVGTVQGSRKGMSWSSGISDHCSAIPIPATFDLFLASLGSTTRSHVRQYIRAVTKVAARFEILRGKDVLNGLSELFRLNGARWDVFANEPARNFLVETVKALPADDDSLFIIKLQGAEDVLAIALCYQNQGTCYVHSAGVVRKSPPGLSPGTAMYALLIQAMVENKQQRLDLSPGLEEYKLRLGANIEPIFRFTLWHKQSPINRWKIQGALLKTKQWLAKIRRPNAGPT